MNFSAFAAVESSRVRQQEERQEQFDVHYQKALDYIQRFQEKNCFHQPFLQKAVHELLAAIPHQRSRVGPYAWLAYAMYILEKDKLFQEYFQIACSIDANYQLVIALKKISTKTQTLVASSQPLRELRRSQSVEKNKPMVLTQTKKRPFSSTSRLDTVRTSEPESVPDQELFSGDFSLQDI